jgi:anthranilate phosphoribosyltransferase
MKIPLDEQGVADCLAAANFTFLFAPHYHPAMKAIAPVRAALGVRTIFNILGPLTNPAGPPFHLIGAFSLDVAKLIAETIAGMPIERTFVVHGAEGWDEPTPIGPFTVFDVRPGRVEVGIRRPEDYGFGPCKSADLAGGDAQHNAGELKAVLEGRDRGPHRDCLLLGTALALEVVGEVRQPREGVERAAHAIESGAARRVLEALARFKAGAATDAAGSRSEVQAGSAAVAGTPR